MVIYKGHKFSKIFMKKTLIECHDIQYELFLNNFTANITESPKASGVIFIPRSIKYKSQDYLVTSIKNCSFMNNHNIKSIDFPEDSALRSIGSKSFENSSLENLTIPPSVKELQEGWCRRTPNLIKVTLSNYNVNFKTIGKKKQIIVGKSVLGNNFYDEIVFATRDIETVTIPKFIKRIRSHAFENCSKLSSIEINDDSKLQSIGACSFTNTSLRSIFIPKTLVKLEEGWFVDSLDLNNVVISPENKYFKYADKNRQIIVGRTNLVHENYEDLVFASRNIKHAKIPKYVKRIKPFAFESCSCLEEIEIPKDSELRFIGKFAFFNTYFNKIFIPSKVDELQDGWCAATGCLSKVEISPMNKFFKPANECNQIIVGKTKNESKCFDDLVFANRNICAVKIPKYIQNIRPFAFEKCWNIQEIEFEENSELKTIGENVFSSSNISRITIPRNVCQIGNCAFYECKKLEFFMLQEGSKLISIPECLFKNCFMLKDVMFPERSSLRSIGASSFCNTSLKSIFIPSNVDDLKDGWCYKTCFLHNVVISQANKQYKNADENSQLIVGKNRNTSNCYENLIFASRNVSQVTIPEYVKNIKPYAFDNCKDLKSIDISEDSNLKNIDTYSFYSSSIESIVIPSKFDFFKKDWFLGITKLNKIIISPTNKYFKYTDESQQLIVGKNNIDDESYDNLIFACRDIKYALIPNYVKRIKSYAFENCCQLNKVEFNENSELIIIEEFAFTKSTIVQIKIPKSVTEIGNSAFFKCEELQSFELLEGSKLQGISKNLFRECFNLKTVKIPEKSSLRFIDSFAFFNTSISTIFIPASVVKLNDMWNVAAKNLKDVDISQKNKCFKYADNDHQLIIGKKDQDSKYFEDLVFVSRNVKEVTIPRYVKHIRSHAFGHCSKLSRIDFECNSELRTIGKNAFYLNPIKKLSIPKHVNVIEDGTFSYLYNLEYIEFLASDILIDDSFEFCENILLVSCPNANYVRISLHAFYNSRINRSPTLSVPAGAVSWIG